MSDLISRDDAMSVIESMRIMLNGKNIFSPNIKDSVLDCLDILPAVDAEPVRQGRWIDKRTGAYRAQQAWCSACGKRSGIGGIKSNQHKPYCPNCGARMDKEATND